MLCTSAFSKRQKDLQNFEDRVVFVQAQVRLAQGGDFSAQHLLQDMEPLSSLRTVWEELCRDHQLEEPEDTERRLSKAKNRDFLSPLLLQTGSSDGPNDDDEHDPSDPSEGSSMSGKSVRR